MKKKIIYGIILLLIVVGGAKGIYSFFVENGDVQYQFAKISRADLENTISASGTLSPVTTVDVGTQVSGTIDSVFVDYNDEVREGQLLAVLDTALLKSSLTSAEADLERSEAQLEQAEADFKRYKKLYEKDLISEADYLPYEINVKTQKANLKSSRASLDRAKRNLDYAVILSPISGTVISKGVESGQTVAASFSTPTLFQIAEDLSRMEILVEVDESDIGMIEVGQSVRFEVQAYSDKIFEGTVRQVRLQPTTVSNVVTYTVVVDAANDDGLLLPGMTATVDFIIDSRENVLVIPNTALKFSPSEDEIAKAFEKRQGRMRARRDSSGTDQQMPMVRNRSGQAPEDMGQVWYLGDDGSLEMAMLKIGLSDGVNTEIIMSRDLKEGMEIISKTGSGSSSSTSNKNSNMGFGGPPPGGRGF